MRPQNIVEKNAQVLIPMDHNALFKIPVAIGGATVNGVAGIDCAVCHKSPGSAWSDGLFHQRIGAAVPADCTTCHYPLMADKAKADRSSGTNYLMSHGSTQLKFQTCQTCHATALDNATQTPVETLWKPGAFHGSLSAQPSTCIDCHAISKPPANASTQSSWTYIFSSGGSSSNAAQWMNHGSAQLGGRDCVSCHASDAKTSGSAWSEATLFHAVVPKPGTCQECHGLSNGGGAVAGTNNNLPQGLTNSSTLTTASADPTTGVPAGTFDQISHSDVNVMGRDCNYCHSQAGISSAAGVAGDEWAQAKFHTSFVSGAALVMNGSTGRCSNCHLNSKPGANFTAMNHSTFTNTSGSADCSSCHGWPGTGTSTSPNWLGAVGRQPNFISVGGFAISQPPATTATTQGGISNLPHPTVASGTACTTCHSSAAGGKGALGYGLRSRLSTDQHQLQVLP